MRGLGGFIVGFGALAVTFVLFVLVGIYYLVASDPNKPLFFAALAAFVTMLVFWALVYLQDYGWVEFPNSYWDVLGPLFILISIVVAIVVYVKV